MNEEFKLWWDTPYIPINNPYTPETLAWWSWEAWQAATKVERERIFGVLLDMHDKTKGTHNYYLHAVGHIKTRSNT